MSRESLRGRLEALSTASVALAAVAPFLPAAWIARELHETWNQQYLSPIQRVFAYGPPPLVTEIGLAGVVLLLMVPSTAPFARRRAVSRLLLLGTLGVNVLLFAGYVTVRLTWENPGDTTWYPSASTILLEQLPTAAVSAVLIWILLRMPQGTALRSSHPAEGKSQELDYLA